MQEKEIDEFLNELEYTTEKTEYVAKVEDFNRSFVESFKGEKSYDSGTFPFGSAMPHGLVSSNINGIIQNSYPVVHSVHYVPYFPPRPKEFYPYEKPSYDLNYWKEKRLYYSKFLHNN